jgi:tetratricopeptide (TPR) repeat protein
LLAIALLLSLTAAAPATSQPVTFEAIGTAKALIARGRTDEARVLLNDLSARYRDSNDIDFILGLLAIQSTDYRQAIDRFRAILVRSPGAVRVRLELARAFFLKGDHANAYRQFQFARAGNPPPGVIATIDRFLGQIRKQKDWSYSFGLAIAPDSNINNGTTAQDVELFGLPFELSDDTRSRSGVGVAIQGALEYAPRLGEQVRVRAGAAIQRRDYAGGDFDDMTVAVHAGPRLTAGKWDVSALATGFQRRFGGRRLAEGAGTRIEASHFFSARTALSLGLSALKVRYPDYRLQDGLSLSASAGMLRALTTESSLTARIGGARKTARTPELANWSGSLAVGYYRDLPGGFSVYAEPSIAEARYDAIDPFFGKRRKDRLLELHLALLNRRISLRGFTPKVGFTLGRRRSSIELYDYNQRRFEFGVTRAF